MKKKNKWLLILEKLVPSESLFTSHENVRACSEIEGTSSNSVSGARGCAEARGSLEGGRSSARGSRPIEKFRCERI